MLFRRLGDGRGVALFLGATLGCLCLFGQLMPVEHGLRTVRDSIRDKDASGALHIVEIDARSLQAIDRWPWPRGEHARLVDVLTKAGARTIAFDVDFSSNSLPEEDRLLSQALERAGGSVILPTLRQSGSIKSNQMIESLPIPVLRDHSFLGAVSILPDSDGYVRSAPIGIVTSGTPRPSLSALLSGRSGTAFTDFPIDFAINPETIPRHSFIDVARGESAGALAGKDVLIGATAVEMGDRYAVPRYGVTPGVVIQALAAETLRNGVPWHIPASVLLLAGLAGAWWCVRAEQAGLIATRAAMLSLAGLCGLTLLEEFLSGTGKVAPALLALWSAALARAIIIMLAHRRAAARRDPESGLPNRKALRECTSNKVVIAGIIDRYDEIAATLGSDRMGHFIARLAERITPAIDRPVYRIDERSLAWGNAEAPSDDMMDRLRLLLLHPIEIDGRRFDVRMALGIATSEQGQASMAIDSATATASKALERGMFWSDASVDAQENGLNTLSLMGELDAAIDRGEIEVHYQPKLALATNRIESAEALVRWKHPERGYIRPDHFIPLAERHNRIDRLTLAVMEASLQALGTLQAISIAVNLSAKLVVDRRFNLALQALLDRYPNVISRLIFEITESATMADVAAAVDALEAYRRRGISISMDDYGTGQSTLSYLRELPLSELKIDRVFVQNAHVHQSDAVLVRSTVELAHQLGLKVVAEGVENRECLDFLRACRCDYAQGWFISKPLPYEALVRLVDTRLQVA